MPEPALQWRHGDTQSKPKGVNNESSMDENESRKSNNIRGLANPYRK